MNYMKTIVLKVRNLPNSVDTDLFVYCMQQDVAVSYPRGKVELVPDIKLYDIGYESVFSELKNDIIRADDVDQSYVDCVSVSTLKSALDLLKLYRYKLG